MVGADWNRRLSERSSIGLSARFSKEGGLQALVNRQTDFLSVSARYDRRLMERLRLVASARYRTISGGTLNQSDDYGGQIGLAYQFGRPR